MFKKKKTRKNLSSGHTLKLEIQFKLFIKNKHKSVLKNMSSVLSTKLEIQACFYSLNGRSE